eukprot:Lankesteria_metandrocarpae@DN2309_c0_g1_i2.p1
MQIGQKRLATLTGARFLAAVEKPNTEQLSVVQPSNPVVSSPNKRDADEKTKLTENPLYFDKNEPFFQRTPADDSEPRRQIVANESEEQGNRVHSIKRKAADKHIVSDQSKMPFKRREREIRNSKR